jgi:hypothetical protein
VSQFDRAMLLSMATRQNGKAPQSLAGCWRRGCRCAPSAYKTACSPMDWPGEIQRLVRSYVGEGQTAQAGSLVQWARFDTVKAGCNIAGHHRPGH